MRLVRRHALLASILAALAVTSCKEAEVPLPPAPPSPPAVAQPTAAEPLQAPPPANVPEQRAAICNIESIDGVAGAALDQPVTIGNGSLVSGWRALVSADGSMAGAWLRVTAADGSVAFQAPLPAVEERPDVAALTGQPVTLLSGFRNVAIGELPAGEFTLEIVLGAGDDWVRCFHARTLVVE